MPERPFVLLFIPVEPIGKGTVKNLFEKPWQIEYPHILSVGDIRRRRVDIVKLTVIVLPVICHVPYPHHLAPIDLIAYKARNSYKQHHDRTEE